jgi:hypothetical protein
MSDLGMLNHLKFYYDVIRTAVEFRKLSTRGGHLTLFWQCVADFLPVMESYFEQQHLELGVTVDHHKLYTRVMQAGECAAFLSQFDQGILFMRDHCRLDNRSKILLNDFYKAWVPFYPACVRFIGV